MVNSSTYTQNAQNADGAVWRLKVSTGATTKLASGIALDLGSVAVDKDRVYFSTYNAIYYVPLPNGGWLYFATYPSEQLMRIPLPYGAAVPSKVADSFVTGTMADQRAVYWSDCVKGVINRCPHAGCQEPEVIAVGQTCPRLSAQDSSSIYWINSGNSGTTVESYPVQRLAK